MKITQELAALKYTNHIMLPLVGVSWFSIQKWLKEVWIAETRKHLVIETSVRIPLIRTGLYFQDQKNRHLTVVPIPDRFLTDVEQFIAGKYSRISDRARRVINDLSGLPYDVLNPETGLTHHHVLLIAIDKSNEMIPWWDQAYESLSEETGADLETLQEIGELLSPPGVREEVFYQGELPF